MKIKIEDFDHKDSINQLLATVADEVFKQTGVMVKVAIFRWQCRSTMSEIDYKVESCAVSTEEKTG